MRLAGIALAPSPRRGSVAASAAKAARKPYVPRRVRCSATAASVGGGDVGDAGELSRAVENRSYAVCLVVEGLSDIGNVSAAFRSADVLGVQSVHAISWDGNKRYRDNRPVSLGAEKWLDIELWNSPAECFHALKKKHGYRISTACLGTDSVSMFDMDWSHPTAIVLGKEHMGISDDTLKLSDLCCSVPMKGGMEGVFVVWQLDTGKRRYKPRLRSPLCLINYKCTRLRCRPTLELVLWSIALAEWMLRGGGNTGTRAFLSLSSVARLRMQKSMDKKGKEYFSFEADKLQIFPPNTCNFKP